MNEDKELIKKIREQAGAQIIIGLLAEHEKRIKNKMKNDLTKKVTKLFNNECKKYKNTPIGSMVQGIKEKTIQELNK